MIWTVQRGLPFEQRLEQVAEAGYRAVELVGETATWSDDDFRRYLKKRDELGITFDTIAGLAHGVGDPSVRDAFLTDVRKQLEVMKRDRVPHADRHVGQRGAGASRRKFSTKAAWRVGNAAADLADKAGVRLLLENIDLEENPHYYMWSVPEAFRIVEEVNLPNVKFLYDFYHAQISGGQSDLKHLEQAS